MSATCESDCDTVRPEAPRYRELLLDPATYPPNGEHVELIQTHISYVALVGNVVYKLAKPVKFDFADFSTLEKRRAHAEREVELNRRLCPDLYLGVVPVVRTDDSLRVDSNSSAGTEVDCAVKMRRLDHRRVLDERIRRGDVSEGDIDRIADRLIAFYQNAETDARMSRHGEIDQLRRLTDETLNDADAAADAGIAPAPVARALRHFRDVFLERNADVFRARVEAGRIRDVHGDLRPEHVFVDDDRICIYDCVAFNDVLRQIDVAADAAFLAMELDRLDHTAWSQRLVTRLFDGLDDASAERVLPFYEFERAGVRAKVEHIRSDNPRATAPQRRDNRRKCRIYLRAALDYAVRGAHPRVLVVMGPVGAGKSTLAQRLYECTGWPVYRSDTIRKQIAGQPLWERAAPSARRRMYRTEMTRQAYTRLVAQAAGMVAQGRCVILDATFGKAAQRSALLAQFAGGPVRCDFIELSRPMHVAAARLSARHEQETVTSDARIEDLDRLNVRYQPADELMADRRMRLDGSAAVDDLAGQVLMRLVEQRCSSNEEK